MIKEHDIPKKDIFGKIADDMHAAFAKLNSPLTSVAAVKTEIAITLLHFNQAYSHHYKKTNDLSNKYSIDNWAFVKWSGKIWPKVHNILHALFEEYRLNCLNILNDLNAEQQKSSLLANLDGLTKVMRFIDKLTKKYDSEEMFLNKFVGYVYLVNDVALLKALIVDKEFGTNGFKMLEPKTSLEVNLGCLNSLVAMSAIDEASCKLSGMSMHS